MSKYAIIVIDVLNEFVTGAIAFETAAAVVEPIARLTNESRKRNVPVIYANDTHISGEDKELVLWGDHALAGTKEAEVVSELKPKNGDYVVSKRSYSAFFNTNLHALLKELGVDTLIVTGLYVHLACRLTIVDAFNMGYKLIVPRETTAAFPDDDLGKNLNLLRDNFGVELCSVDDAVEFVKYHSEVYNSGKLPNDKLSNEDGIFSNIIGWDLSLSSTINKAKKTVGALGGPRHCIITGESGTGKTMLAEAIYLYAKSLGVIGKDAPFVEVNCAQFTNPDIAAMEIFGSTEGAYTGSKNKKGLFEMADGGVLFLDETHRLEQYQDLLLKSLESKKIKRIGGTDYIPVEVIVIGASTENLTDVLTPALYQRLAQNILAMPPLRERSISEKKMFIDNFVSKYIVSCKKRYGIELSIGFTPEAEKLLISGFYPRNIRQLRDVIFASIDEAVPLINYISENSYVDVVVDINHLPDIDNGNVTESQKNEKGESDFVSELIKKSNRIDQMIEELNKNGYGARKIAKILNDEGYDIKYYQVAYKLKMLKQ